MSCIPRQPPDSQQFANFFASWRDSRSMRDFFPRQGDAYVDGGAIDNTPSNSAVDFVREWAEQAGLSKREVVLELFVIFLGAEPTIQGAGNPGPQSVPGGETDSGYHGRGQADQ